MYASRNFIYVKERGSQHCGLCPRTTEPETISYQEKARSVGKMKILLRNNSFSLLPSRSLSRSFIGTTLLKAEIVVRFASYVPARAAYT